MPAPRNRACRENGKHPACLPMTLPMAEGPSTETVQCWLEQIARGDERAFVQLYDAFSGLLFGYLQRFIFEVSDAEDVLQDVFLQVWRRAAQYDRAAGKPVNWILTMARNKALDWRRKHGRTDRALEKMGSELEARVRVMEEPGEGAAAREASSRVQAALASLAAAQREAICLAFFEGLTQTEISARLGEPLGTVKARIRRGMLQLRDRLVRE